MNKALHALVYVFLVLAGAALWFELQLNDKRSVLTDRNRQQEDYLVRLAQTIEKAEPTKGPAIELKKDVSPVEARLVDTPDTENVLESYKGELEQSNLETFKWDDISTRNQLRRIYAQDPATGELIMDGDKPYMKGAGTSDELLASLFEAAKAQQSRLNTTRAELVSVREKLEEAIAEINKLKPEDRQDKVTIEEKKANIAKLEEQKAGLENDITKLKAQIEELNAEITSVKDELTTTKDDLEAKKDDIAKQQKTIEQLQKIIKELVAARGASSGGSSEIKSVPAGEKGKVVDVDNEDMFAIVSFTEEAMKELKGNNPDAPLPILEFSVKRVGFKGTAGEFVGRLRLRQEIKGKNLVICDVLGSWEQDKMKVNDVVFAD